jgi:hypothetical protein
MTERIEVRIDVVTRVLAGLVAFLALAYLAGQYAKYFLGHDYLKGFVPLFDLDAELNAPAYFSLLLLIFASQLLAIVALLAREAGDRHASQWLILCLGFLALAFDEGFSVHEQLVGPVRELIGSDKLGAFHYAWVIPGLVLTAFLGVCFLRFLSDLPAPTRWRFVIAAAFFVGGAIGVEMMEGWYVEANELPRNLRDFRYSLMVVLEECAGEMGGVVLFIRALLLHCAEHHAEARLVFRRSPSDAIAGITVSRPGLRWREMG